MKTFRVLLILLSLGIFCSCNDDDGTNNDSLELSATFLKQTSWKGTIVETLERKEITQCDIGISFSTGNKGNYVLDVYSLVYSDRKEGMIGKFSYSVDKKLLTIEYLEGTDESSSYVEREWWLIKKNNDELIFKSEPYTENFDRINATLRLTKTY